MHPLYPYPPSLRSSLPSLMLIHQPPICIVCNAPSTPTLPPSEAPSPLS